MKHSIRAFVIPGAIATALANLNSCVVTQQRIDFSVFADAAIPAQDDDVNVEVGRGLPDDDRTASAPAPATTANTSTPAIITTSATSGKYTVLKGDTLSGIARKHNIPLSALYAANGLSEEKSGIRDGQILNIPASSRIAAPSVTPKPVTTPRPTPAAAVASNGKYTVTTGDTLSSIAKRHGISTAALIRANGLTKETADKLSIGQTLNIPTKNP